MEYAVGIAIDARDIAAIVEPTSIGVGRAGIIDRGEPAPGQLEGMVHTANRIGPNDIAALVV